MHDGYFSLIANGAVQNIIYLYSQKSTAMPSLFVTPNTNKICYMILPEGVREDLDAGLKELAGKYGVSIVVIPGANWNDDLTPWPAEGVFKKAKPFGGRAASFLDKLTNTIIPETERSLGMEDVERTILGGSLSGLFAVWAGFHTNAFTNIISLSGSLWYDGFVDWMREQTPSSQVKKVCLLLGEKEKNAKDKRMATVEERTFDAADILKSKSQAAVTFEIVEGTHFSPILPRLERAFEVVFGPHFMPPNHSLASPCR